MIQKWTLVSKEDISPSPHFRLEKRAYTLPDGKKIDDFYVTTIEDVALIIPVTKEGKLVLVRQYKPGADAITIEFPQGSEMSRLCDTIGTYFQINRSSLNYLFSPEK